MKASKIDREMAKNIGVYHISPAIYIKYCISWAYFWSISHSDTRSEYVERNIRQTEKYYESL